MPGQQTTRISVVSSPNQACPAETWMGINWTVTAVGTTNFQFCPSGFFGAAKRLCRRSSSEEVDQQQSTNVSTWKWETPDLSHCAERTVVELHRELKLIMLGYAVSDVPTIVSKLVFYVRNKMTPIQPQRQSPSLTEHTPEPFLPGEGNSLLELARTLETFLYKRPNLLPTQFWSTVAVDYFYTLDALLAAPPGFYHPDVRPLPRLLKV